ncbi:dienelactone hydrolase [Nocardia sp. MDA0666]|uniref:dienelactone hydrolase family protein n=1 Tax=Nocardia sp. MDA0666 TaxID=2135448 RepID=UPI000D120A97|nr:dienelactone hydrolase family protein [Nocardia sp. MDA0666]PSR60360.1 dienelactone hydrolase [Nocardia sp. MDA0666]
MTAVQVQTVEIATPDGVADAYVTYPAAGRRYPGVLLYMDAFGLRPSLRALADDFAAAGYTVLVPNVFYRHGRAPLLELPDFIDPQQRPDLFATIAPMLRELTPDLVVRDAGAYLDWLTAFEHTAQGPIATAGYCMGGRLAVYTAGAFGDRIAAAAGFHTGGLVVDGPDSPHLAVENASAEMYFGHADQDRSLTPEQIETFDKALAAAGVRYRAEVYPGAHHGYTQTDTAAYDREADERHRRELLALLDRTLRG